MKTLKTNADYQALFAEFLEISGISAEAVQSYLDGYCPQPGNYLLKNGNVSPHPVYDQESGIYYTPNDYIDLVAISNCQLQMTAAEAKLWCKMNNYILPTPQELQKIEPHLKTVNGAMCEIYMNNQLLPENYLQTCWNSENVNEDDDEKVSKRLVILGHKDNIPEIVIFMGNLKSHFHP